MTLLKTVMKRDHEGVLRKRAEYWRIPSGIEVGESTQSYDTIDAKAVFFFSNAALEVRIPSVNPDGSTSEVTHLSAEVPSSKGVMVDSKANTVGHITSNVMPPFFRLKVSGATTNSLGAVYITF